MPKPRELAGTMAITINLESDATKWPTALSNATAEQLPQ